MFHPSLASLSVQVYSGYGSGHFIRIGVRLSVDLYEKAHTGDQREAGKGC